jgi:SET domain-containing protein
MRRNMIERFPALLVELRPSGIDVTGVGVFAAQSIEKGQKVADGVPEEDFQKLVPWKSFPKLSEELQRKVMAFCIGTPDGFVPPPDYDFNTLSTEWYLSHSCEGNCGLDEEGDVVALRNIQKGEELSYDYALVESNPNFSMKCNCGSNTCRGVITGKDWKDEKFVQKNRNHLHPRLRRLLTTSA